MVAISLAFNTSVTLKYARLMGAHREVKMNFDIYTERSRRLIQVRKIHALNAWSTTPMPEHLLPLTM